MRPSAPLAVVIALGSASVIAAGTTVIIAAPSPSAQASHLPSRTAAREHAAASPSPTVTSANAPAPIRRTTAPAHRRSKPPAARAPKHATHAATASARTQRTGAGLSAAAFGMHWLNSAHPYPQLAFGAARTWDMVDWAQLQPTADSRFDSSNSELVYLDQIVDTFRSHGADPVITLGMTPSWAADNCNHVSDGVDWGVRTCAPRDTSASGPWGTYVRAMAKRYRGKVRYFETWNEPSLKNGWNDTTAKLARMQAVAASILHAYGEKVVSPPIPFTNGDPSNGMHWLDGFLSAAGGKSFDIAGFHLYPSDDSVRGGYGPEWSVRVALADARAVLARHGLSKPIWNTEMNIGRVPAHTGYGESALGAAMVARTYLLSISSGVRRTFWYAADDRSWGGTWLLRSDYRTLTPGGLAEKFLAQLVTRSRVQGCSSTSLGSNSWRYQCRFSLSSGRLMTAVWQTSGTWNYRTPSGSIRYYTPTGATYRVSGGQTLKVGPTPLYVIS